MAVRSAVTRASIERDKLNLAVSQACRTNPPLRRSRPQRLCGPCSETPHLHGLRQPLGLHRNLSRLKLDVFRPLPNLPFPGTCLRILACWPEKGRTSCPS